MTYRIKLVSDEVNNFYRVIEIDSDATFLELRKAILDSVGYSTENIDSFAICSEDWEPQEEIMLEDTGFNSSDRDTYMMDNTRLSELIEDEGQKLCFIFDNLNERAFFMELKEITFGNDLDAPRVAASQGNPPEQEKFIIDIPEVKTTDTLAGDLGFEDSEEGYDEDDYRGLDEMDMER